MLSSNDTTIIEVVQLTTQEVELIKAIRHKWKFGELVIQVRNGQPFRMVRVQEFIDLTKST